MQPERSHLISQIISMAIMNKIETAKAERYRQYLLGWAYIPPQDLPSYESAYKKWSHQ